MILIIDDDHIIRSSLTLLLERAGYQTCCAANPQAALDIVRSQPLKLILMDMNFSLNTTGEEGLILMKQVKIFQPDVPIILITAWGSIELAVKGMREGAFDFITKPWKNMLLLQRIETALQLHPSSQETNDENLNTFARNSIIGKSQKLTTVLQTVARVAHTNAPILITGESGTGKELIAEAIHQNSPRAKNAFVKVNLGGISQTLFESEMFGHKKGAFTDASGDRIGRFELAHKGTIFLDEIGELDLSCQVKLLRVLQDQTFEVLGESRPRKADVRIVCATNANLWNMVDERTFREDLFYRINLITVQLPPLRERTEDIPLLSQHFADLLSKNYRLPHVKFTDEAMTFLCRLPYPGNIRELKNLVERTLLVSGKTTITAADIEKQYVKYEKKQSIAQQIHGMSLDQLEEQAIRNSMEQYNNNISKVAASLGISRSALYRRLEKYNIPTPNQLNEEA